jgi:hypothetical protein
LNNFKALKKINSILLVNSDTPENFLNYRMLKKMDISREIYIEKNGTAALDFIERYKKQTDGLIPELIIFEFRGAGDLFFLDHMRQCDMEKALLMMFNLQKSKISAKFSQSVYYKNGYLSPSDITNTLQERISKVKVA